MNLGRIWAVGVVGVLMITGCVPGGITVVKPVHVADPPKLVPGTDDGPLNVAKDVTAPVIIYGPEASYSAAARRRKETCMVGISIVVTKEGTVSNELLTDSCKDLDANALKTVATYRFKPAMKDGHPVAVRVEVEVGFTIY